jgi:peptide deformylase
MPTLHLRHYDDPILRIKGKPVEKINGDIIQLATDMIETMIASNGVGLAAPQIGKLLRIFIIRDEKLGIGGEETVLGVPEVIINPTLSNFSKEKSSMLEGCLSLPGLQLDVIRPIELDIRYQNLKGEWIEERLKDFRARVVMHEFDHLEGLMIIHRITKNEQKKIESQLLAMKRKYHPHR